MEALLSKARQSSEVAESRSLESNKSSDGADDDSEGSVGLVARESSAGKGNAPAESVDSPAKMPPHPSVQSSATTAASAAQGEDKLFLKKTCEPCVRSKVRCSGATPCERCTSRGVECYFMAEQKRGRRPGTTLVRTSEGKKRARHEDDDDISEPAAVSAQNAVAAPALLPAPTVLATARPVPPSFDTLQMLMRASMPRVGGVALPAPPFSVELARHHHAPSWTSMFMSPQPASSNLQIATVGSQWLPKYERRLVRVLFALFRQHLDTVYPSEQHRRRAFAWFDGRFCLVRSQMFFKFSPDEALMLTNWMVRNGLRLEASLSDVVVLASALEMDSPPPREGLPQGRSHIGSIKVTVGSPQVEFDDQLMHWLGCSSATFTSSLTWPPHSLLPIGTEVMADIAALDEDVLAYALDVGIPVGQQLARDWNRGLSGQTAHCSRGIRLVHQREGAALECVVVAEPVMMQTAMTVVSATRKAINVHFHFAPPVQEHYSSRDLGRKLGPWPLNSLLLSMPPVL